MKYLYSYILSCSLSGCPRKDKIDPECKYLIPKAGFRLLEAPGLIEFGGPSLHIFAQCVYNLKNILDDGDSSSLGAPGLQLILAHV